VSNRGCRPCADGQYHYDQAAMCVPCGSRCAAGYKVATLMVDKKRCNSTVTTSALLWMAEENPERQLAIGCVPCPTLNQLPSGVRFLGNGTCEIACTRSSALLTSNYTTDRYCNQAVDATTGGCRSGICISCATWLNSWRDNTQMGQYPQGCVDRYGYRWTDCEGLPPHAHWTSGTPLPNDVRGCSWECDACAWSMSMHSACRPCGLKGQVSCASGSRLISCAQMHCSSQKEYEVCVPCDGRPPFARQVWTSEAPFYSQCTPDCEPGLGYSENPGDECTACTRMGCAMGTYLIPCVPRADATCGDCPLMPANAEFVTQGSCETRCVSGYYMDAESGACVDCTLLACAIGSRRSSECEAVGDRVQAPTCVECSGGPPPSGMRWASGCAFECVAGAVSLVGNNGSSCVPCAPSMCGLGHQGACVTLVDGEGTRLVCVVCALAPPQGSRWAVGGDCGASVCLEGHTLTAYGTCAPPPPLSPIGGSTPAPSSSSSPEKRTRGASTSGLPTRSLRHS
jgi:hypothetical protein